MTDDDQTRLPAASTRQGDPGHDTAAELANGAELLRLRALGMTYEQIAQERGYSDKGSARHALVRALARHEAENAVELRQIENVRYDMDERALRAIIGDTSLPAGMRIRAVDARTRLSARRARLNGLDAPLAVQISAGVLAGMDDALRELESVVGEVLEFKPREPIALPGPEDEEAQEA